MAGIYIQNAQIPKYGQRISILSDGCAYYEDMVNPYRDLGNVICIKDHGDLIDKDVLLEKRWDADTRCGYVQVVDVGTILEAPVIISTDKEELKKMNTEISIIVHGDSVTIEEANAEPVTFKISDDSYESAIYDIGEALKDYLEGLG